MDSTESIAVTALVRPLVVLVLMALVVLPIEWLLAKVWPEGRLKRVLFDRTFRKRYPGRFAAVAIGLWALLGFVVMANAP